MDMPALLAVSPTLPDSLRSPKRWAVGVACAVLLGGCGPDSVSWTENVRSADGQTLILRRTTAFSPRDGRVAKVTIEVPGQAPAWRSTRYSPLGHPEVPLVFNMEGNVPT